MYLRDLYRMSRELEDRIRAGPPEGVHVSRSTWRQFIIRGAFVCPASGEGCRNRDCVIGTQCAVLAAEKGMHPAGSPLPRKDRPSCGAKTRAGGMCSMKVEPGKRRCRLHGGRSTGPKTEEGRARIAAAQRARWILYRSAPNFGETSP